MSLVSKRFRALCLAPQLTREVSFALNQQTDCASTQCSLQCWMAANAQHLAGFSMSIRTDVDLGLVTACLSACCAVAPLEELKLQLGDECTKPLSNLAWLLSARSTLRRLELDLSSNNNWSFSSTRPLSINAPLQHCTSLTQLPVQCQALDFEFGCRMPTSLTYLRLRGHKDGLPSQVSKPHQHTQRTPLTEPDQCCHMVQILALPQLAVLGMEYCECQLRDDPQSACVGVNHQARSFHLQHPHWIPRGAA